jgi:hypothetical protein
MGKKYQVICLNVGGKNNKVFKNKDFVDAEDFEEGVAEQLVKSNHLKSATKQQSDKISKEVSDLSKKDKEEAGEKSAQIQADKEKRTLAKNIINLEGKVKEFGSVSDASKEAVYSISKELRKDKDNSELKKALESAEKDAKKDAEALKEAESALKSEKKKQGISIK